MPRSKPLFFTSADIGSRFWENVPNQNPAECWLWRGAIHQNKGQPFYSSIKVDGKAKLAHRIAWSLANNQEIPKGKFICHRCDFPPCVNPDHLFMGDPKDNTQDMIFKGRQDWLSGDRSGARKLWLREVMEMRNQYTGARGEQAILSAKYKISGPEVIHILRGTRWGLPRHPLYQPQGLSPQTVREIRRLVREEGRTQKSVAKDFGLGTSHVNRIILGRAYADIV